ncbi:MAG: 1-phosphofructokinase [Phycisphaerales bacterium]|nr:1-phosphofructokinase [Phycisphaerales bacterium]
MNTALPIITVTLNPAIDLTLSIPGFAAGKVNRVADVQTHAAGKGVNVATMLADLGATVTVTGLLGSRNAEPFQLLFAQKRIDDQFVRVPGETRTGFKISDDASGQTTDINFPGLKVPAAAIDELTTRLATMVRPGSWVVLAGSVPPDVSGDIYGRLIEVIRAKGGRVALDTSGAPLKAALAFSPDLAKPNVAELAELVGRELPTPADIVAAAREVMTDRGVSLAAISMGEDGAIFITAEQAVRTFAPAVAVKSTVGAGDAMVAGLVFAMANGLPLDEAARLSTALGTYAVTRIASGLEAGGHKPYLQQVRVETI